MEVSLIKFKAAVPENEQLTLIRSVEFKLGLGPCGRHVAHLESQIDYHGVTITQTSYPEDWPHINKTATTMLGNWQRTERLIRGRGYPDQRPGYGYGNIAAMTPTKEQHLADKKALQEMTKRAEELYAQREIKTFFYKLEDVRGRIVAIKK